LSQQGLAGFNYVSLFPLSNTILLRGVQACKTVKNAILAQKLFEGGGGVFTTIISLKIFNRRVSQSLMPNHVSGFDTKESSEPGCFIQGMRVQPDGVQPIPLGPWSRTFFVKLSFTVKSISVRANQHLLSLQNLLIESKLAEAEQCKIFESSSLKDAELGDWTMEEPVL